MLNTQLAPSRAIPVTEMVAMLIEASSEPNGLDFVSDVALLELKLLIVDELRDRNIR
jgi:hypothetical protein